MRYRGETKFVPDEPPEGGANADWLRALDNARWETSGHGGNSKVWDDAVVPEGLFTRELPST